MEEKELGVAGVLVCNEGTSSSSLSMPNPSKNSNMLVRRGQSPVPMPL